MGLPAVPVLLRAVVDVPRSLADVEAPGGEVDEQVYPACGVKGLVDVVQGQGDVMLVGVPF